nr:uncharacterized protein LOC107438365 isoform X1 [Parasteatoda tepidariorum]XP_042900245.1 uncharacterized protein LOC107438365 isoform X1 [Parasteatoda tepidariorum]
MLELMDAIIYDYGANYESFDSLVHISPFPPFNLPDQVKQTIGLCVRMMKNKLAQCCPVMLDDLHATLNDDVWNEKNSCEIVCPFDCLKNAVEDCYPEGGDLTLGLMIHIFYCKDVYAAIEDCFQRVASELMICCPSATEAIISIHRGHYFPWNETELGHCDILCVMQKISHCDKQDINMIQKLFKYTIDYLQKDVNNYDQGTNVAPVRDLRNINKCFEVMEPILEICCPAMKGAVYTLLNSEPWPLIDGPNLKRCNYFCYRLAAQKCSPDTALFASSIMNQAVSIPAVGYQKFTENCHSIISEALSCCDAIVLSVFQRGFPYNDISLNSRECRSVCKMRLISDCLAHSENYEHLSFLIKSHFDPSNANISKAALKYKEDLMLSPRMHNDLMRRSRQIVEEPVETEKTVVIPLLMKERARSCIYLVHRDAVDACWPGFYDFVLYLCNRIKFKPLSLPMVNANQCLQDIFKVCSVESNLIISSLVETYLNTTVQLVEENIPDAPRDVIDEETKRTVETCLQEIDPGILQDCMPSFQRIMTSILENGQSLANFKPKADSKDCQAEVFGVCSMQARLLIMKIFYQFQGIVLKIPIVFKTSHVNVMRLISENEKLLVDECLMTVNEDEANDCLPDLYLILSGLSVGLFEISSENNSSWQVCLKHVFRHCSRHTRFIITDLIKFVTGNTVSIQYDYRKSMKSEQIITIAERELITPCLAVVDQALLKQCAPELLDVIATIMDNRRPSTNLYPIRILSSSCFEPAFKNCSADARLILTELVSRHTMTYVSLLFAVSGNGTIDSGMVNVLNECVQTVNQEVIVGCIAGLQDLLEKLSSGILPSSNPQLKLETEAEPSCPKEIFSGCSTYHRILIDELLRKSHHEFKNTVLFEIFNPTDLDSGLHVHNFIDEQILKECFSTLNQQSLEYCIPGLYNALEKFINFSLSETFFALRPIKRWCLDMNFAHCTYQARILITELFFDFYRFTVDLPLEKSPEGLSANMGPPLDYVQKCIINLDKNEADLCSPGLSVYLRQTFINNEEGFKPILPAGKENQMMKCLTRALKCDLDISVHILKSIAEMNNINFHVQLTEQNNESNGWQIAFTVNRVNETG